MQFALYHENTRLKPNQYGILEPQSDSFMEANKLDLVLVPLIAFDSYGNRLGTGGGFYDRTFAFKKTSAKPILTGVGFNLQAVDKIPTEEFDIPVQSILNETDLIEVKEFNR